MNSEQSALFLYEEAMSYTYAAALRAAALIGVADHVAGGPRGLDELAEATGARPDGLRRILRILATRGIFHEEKPDVFGLTAAGDAMRADAPRSARSGILMFTDRLFWQTSHAVGDSVRATDPSIAEFFGQSIPDYFAAEPTTEALFYEGMEAVSDAENDLIAHACTWPEQGTVADIGGRYGGFLRSVLMSHPLLHGILLDRADEVVKHRLDEPELAGRWEVVAGDFFTEVPPADVHVLKRIIHNWDDQQCVQILGTCRRALRPGGRVLVIDAIVPPGEDSHQSKAMDFMMLAAFTGRERTAEELRPLFADAGLRMTRVTATSTPMSVIEAVVDE
ncbi:methyltransferase [Nocardia transvalensis]|uniref:methyltransferase n=1 Tax=Nocardia transvalensis TaxID=37333 RepID=UPI001893358E|nr:methyltransferase [Nocardia transvalensis]MBF6329820.1 methyltransferase [Nocardia transvalensis]